MKVFKTLLISWFLVIFTSSLSAQSPPHPNGGNAPGTGSTPVGGGAPIDGGLIILMAMGAAYGWRSGNNQKRSKQGSSLF